MSTHEADGRRGGAKRGADDKIGGGKMSWDDLTALDDAELLAQTRQGNEDAYGELWRRYTPGAVRMAAKMGCPSPEDIVAEIWVRVLKKIRDGVGPTENIEGYLMIAVRNLVRMPRANRSEAWDEADGPLVLANENVEQTMISDADDNRIEQVLARMPEREARLLRATAMDGVPVWAAAKAEGVTSNHASVILKRARRTFQKLWIQSHANVNSGGSTECRWVLEQAGAYLSGSLAKTRRERVEKHLRQCDACAVAVSDVNESSHSWVRGAAGGAAGLLPSGIATTAWGAPLAPVLVTGGALATAAGVTAGLLMIPIDAPRTPPPTVVVISSAPAAADSSSPIVVQPPGETSAAEAPAPVESSFNSARPSSPSPVQSSSSARPSIVVAGADNGPAGLCYPVLSGTAEPGGQLRVTALGWGMTVAADGSGHWQTPPLTDMTRGSMQVTVSYSEGYGGAAQYRVTLAGPPDLSVTPRPDGLVVTASGQAGQFVEILVDGNSLGTAQLGEDGTYRGTYQPLTPGQHTIALRYAQNTCQTPTVTLTIEA